MVRLASRQSLAPGWDHATQLPLSGHEEQLSLPLFVRRSDPRADLPSAVFVHGLGGQSMNWTDVMALLSHRFHGVAPDLPGFGRSQPPPDHDYTLDATVRLLAEVVAAEHERTRRPVLLVGNSLGGALCVRLAARFPQHVDSLILISPALPDLRPRSGTVLVPMMALPRVGPAMAKQVHRVPADRQVDAMVMTNFGEPSRFPESRRHVAVTEYELRTDHAHAPLALAATARALLRTFRDRSDTGLWRELASVQQHTLLIYGGRDRLVDVRRAERARRSVPRADLVVLPDVGHVAQIEVPELVARFMLGFIDESAHSSLRSPA